MTPVRVADEDHAGRHAAIGEIPGIVTTSAGNIQGAEPECIGPLPHQPADVAIHKRRTNARYNTEVDVHAAALRYAGRAGLDHSLNAIERFDFMAARVDDETNLA